MVVYNIFSIPFPLYPFIHYSFYPIALEFMSIIYFIVRESFRLMVKCSLPLRSLSSFYCYASIVSTIKSKLYKLNIFYGPLEFFIRIYVDRDNHKFYLFTLKTKSKGFLIHLFYNNLHHKID